MRITTEIVTSIDRNLAEELKKLFVQTFMQLPIYAGRDQLVFDAIDKEIQLFSKKSDSLRHAVIAKDKGQVVGLIFIDLLKDRMLYLAQGAISKSYQGQGIAKEMLGAFLTVYFNIAGAIVLTRKDNENAIQLYKKNGFKENPEIYNRYPFLKTRGYDYSRFVPFEISLLLIEKHYPGIRFKYAEMEDIDATATKEKDLTLIRSCL